MPARPEDHLHLRAPTGKTLLLDFIRLYVTKNEKLESYLAHRDPPIELSAREHPVVTLCLNVEPPLATASTTAAQFRDEYSKAIVDCVRTEALLLRIPGVDISSVRASFTTLLDGVSAQRADDQKYSNRVVILIDEADYGLAKLLSLATGNVPELLAVAHEVLTDLLTTLKNYRNSHSIFVTGTTSLFKTAGGGSSWCACFDDLTNHPSPPCSPPHLGLTIGHIKKTFSHHVNAYVAHTSRKPRMAAPLTAWRTSTMTFGIGSTAAIISAS